MEQAYQLADVYIRECEKLQNISHIETLSYSMLIDFTERVSQNKIPQGMSLEIFECIQFITHHINEAEDADRVIVMDDGQVVLDGGPREVFTKVEALRSMGLTVPDTIDLLDRLRRDGVAVPPDALTVEECADAIAAALGKK